MEKTKIKKVEFLVILCLVLLLFAKIGEITGILLYILLLGLFVKSLIKKTYE